MENELLINPIKTNLDSCTGKVWLQKWHGARYDIIRVMVSGIYLVECMLYCLLVGVPLCESRRCAVGWAEERK